VVAPQGVRFAVRLAPGSSARQVDGVLEGALRVRVTARAVEGAANAALVELLAEELDVPRRDVRIVAGATATRKLVAVDGIDRATVIARWPGLQV
jgi:uncharacterized protein YggU (UPF0235/DUF167 family)